MQRWMEGVAEKDGGMSFSILLCFLSFSALKNGDQKKLLFRGNTFSRK
jgi:hypothetical protein